MTSRQKQKKGSACLFLYWMWGRTMWIMWITWCITGFCEKKEVFLCGQKRNILSKESVDNVENVEKKHETCLYLKKFFLEAMAQSNVPFIIVSPANSVPSTIAICVKDIESEILADMLSEQEIFISTGSACTSGNMENDMFLEAMEIPDEYIHGLIRISTDPSTNTYLEMAQAAKAIEESYNKLVG